MIGDYSGRYGYGGGGTDCRIQMQDALNAASDTSVGNLAARRGQVVRLDPGHYYIGQPAAGPSLTIPPGVTLDATAATLYFQYPNTPRTDWCGIRMGSYSSLILGRLVPVGSPPDSSLLYDAVRIVDSNNGSASIHGLGDAEIVGFAGAAVRGVGAWVTRISGVRFVGGAYGYVASNHYVTGAAFGAGDVSLLNAGSTVRTHTDITFRDCSFTDQSRAAFVGVVTGQAADPYAPDLAWRVPAVTFDGCVIENIPTTAIQAHAFDIVSLRDCALEEVGPPSGAVVSVTQAQLVTLAGVRWYWQGARLISDGAGGTTKPTPTAFLAVQDVARVDVAGMSTLLKVSSVPLVSGAPGAAIIRSVADAGDRSATFLP